MRAPALTDSTIARPTSSGLAVGKRPLAGVSVKIGRTSSVHPGQIAGATELRFATKMPATNVPWTQAPLSNDEQALTSPATGPIVAPAKSGWSTATGPSTRPIPMSGLPVVSAIRCPRLTSCKAADEAGGTSITVYTPAEQAMGRVCIRRVQSRSSRLSCS